MRSSMGFVACKIALLDPAGCIVLCHLSGPLVWINDWSAGSILHCAIVFSSWKAIRLARIREVHSSGKRIIVAIGHILSIRRRRPVETFRGIVCRE